jgi:hypothetical protein
MGAYVPDDVLYKDARNNQVMDPERFIRAGSWLKNTFVLSIFVGAGFVAVVWSLPSP